jgi:hypothetical protein
LTISNKTVCCCCTRCVVVQENDIIFKIGTLHGLYTNPLSGIDCSQTPTIIKFVCLTSIHLLLKTNCMHGWSFFKI